MQPRRTPTSFVGTLLGVAGFVAVFCAVQACKPSENSTNTSGGAGTPTSPPGTGPGTNYLNSDFYLFAITPKTSISTLHRWDDWTQPCRIHSTDTAPTTNMYCYLDIEEADNYFAGLDYYLDKSTDDRMGLQYNVPAGMCAYFQFIPVYFFQYQVGTGPSQVLLTIDDSGVASPTYTDGGDGTGADARALYTKAVVNSATGACSLDFSSSVAGGSSGNGPNCCIGKYTLQTHHIPAAGASPVPDTFQSDVPWGGDWGKCLSGPAADPGIWPHTATIQNVANSWPIPAITNLQGNPLSETFMFYGGGAAFEVNADRTFQHTNLLSANYFQMTNPVTDYPNSANWPLAYLGPTVAFNNGFFAQKAYEAVCYDHAYDVLARIRLMIRAWSKDSEYVKSSGGNPILGGTEPNFADQGVIDFPGWLDYGAQTPPFPEGISDWTSVYPGPGQ